MLQWFGLLLVGLALALARAMWPRPAQESSVIHRGLWRWPWVPISILVLLLLSGLAAITIAILRGQRDAGTRSETPSGPSSTAQASCPALRPHSSTSQPSSPVGVYLTQDEDRSHTIYGINLANGQRIWSTTLDQTPIAAVRGGEDIFISTKSGRTLAITVLDGVTRWQKAYGDPVAYDHGSVFTAGEQGLTSINAATGELEWAQRTPMQFGGPNITVTDGRVITVERAGVVSRSEEDGHVLWSYALPRSRPAQPVFAIGLGFLGTRAYFADDQRVVSVDVVSAQSCWLRKFASGDWHRLVGNVVLVGSPRSGSLAAMDAHTGRTLWTQRVPSAADAVGHASGKLYVRSDERLYALDAGTGRTLWSTPVSLSSDIVVTGQTVSAVRESQDGNSAVLVNVGDGRDRWRSQVGATPNAFSYVLRTYRSSVIVTDERFVTRAFDSTSGRELWTFAPGTPGIINIE
jgi:outer membrane protein assembly factor BamB